VSQAKMGRPVVVYAILVWMALSIVVVALLILGGDGADLNNWIEIALWFGSIVGVLSLRRWGFAFTIFTLSYTLSTSVGIVIYYGIWINALRVIINIPIIIYLFRELFSGKLR
jgi:hypothetical protein